MGSSLIGFWEAVGLKKFFTNIDTEGAGTLLPQTRVNYQSSYSDESALLRNSIVGGCVNWMARTFPEADLSVRRYDETTQQTVAVPDHPLRVLLNRPNPYFSGRLLRMALCTDFIVTGNAFLIKVRSADTSVVGLWWAPSSTLTPATTSRQHQRGYGSDEENAFISHYDYSVGSSGASTQIPVEDVIHFRFGISPDDTRVGRSPLASVFRELFTDDEAANFTAALLRNSAIPGVVLAPGEGVGAVNEEDLNQIRDRWSDQFGSDNRGRLMVMRGPPRSPRSASRLPR